MLGVACCFVVAWISVLPSSEVSDTVAVDPIGDESAGVVFADVAGDSPRSNWVVSAVGPVSPPPSPQQAEAPVVLTRSGLWGYGLGLEAPMVGVTTHIAGGRVTFGYAAGGSVSIEALPNLLLRVYLSAGRTYNERPTIGYREAASAAPSTGEDITRPQTARWFDVEFGGGLAYLGRTPDASVVPYFGADIAAAYAGYEYVFSETDPLTAQNIDESTIFTPTRGQDALAWGWLGSLRTGVRLTMRSWLMTQAEVAVSYWPGHSQPVRNTFTALAVHSMVEPAWLVRTTFSVRLGL